jgi:cytochrome P450
MTRWILDLSTKPLAQVAELMNIGRDEPVGLQRAAVGALDRAVYAVIRARRDAPDVQDRRDILSLLIGARTEEGEALTDRELRDELLTLVLAGHETTANQLAWTWERLVRAPAALDRLVASVRSDAPDASQVIESTLQEGMRSRPVIPVIGRRVSVPWRLGEYAVPADTAVSMSILLVHHREDLYPDPFAFRPERWEGHKPGTYEWIPFGGGIRRCLGAALAMTEQRIVLREMARSVDLAAPRDAEPERAWHRNVTMLPARGAQVVVRARAARAAAPAAPTR